MKAFRHDVGILAFLPFLMRMQAFEPVAPAVTRRKENLLSSAGVGLTYPAPLFFIITRICHISSCVNGENIGFLKALC